MQIPPSLCWQRSSPLLAGSHLPLTPALTLRVIGSLILKYREEGAGKGSKHLISPGLALFSEESWMEALPADPQFLWLYYHEYQKKQDAGQPREHPGWLGGSLHKTPVTGAALSPSNRIWSRE